MSAFGVSSVFLDQFDDWSNHVHHLSGALTEAKLKPIHPIILNALNVLMRELSDSAKNDAPCDILGATFRFSLEALLKSVTGFEEVASPQLFAEISKQLRSHILNGESISSKIGFLFPALTSMAAVAKITPFSAETAFELKDLIETLIKSRRKQHGNDWYQTLRQLQDKSRESSQEGEGW